MPSRILALCFIVTLAVACGVDGCLFCQLFSTTRCGICRSGNDRRGKSCCTSSLSNCDTCFADRNQCDACESDSYLLINGDCNTACSDLMTECDRCSSTTVCTDCGDDTWVLNSTSLCEKCDTLMYQCERCSSVNTCTSCYVQHAFNASGQCQLCSQMFVDCLECDPSACTLCLNTSYALNGSSECELCSITLPNCYTCSDNTTCTQCVNDSFIINSTSGQCVPCLDYLPFCDTCNSSNTCTMCQNDTTIVMTSDNQCVYCGNPIPNCIECLTQTFCTLCQPLYVLRDGVFSECSSCSSVMFGCHDCTSQDVCISCYVGKPVNFGCSSTPGCLSVFPDGSSSVCSTCDPQYFYAQPINGQCQCLEGHLAQNYCTTIVGCKVANNGTEGVYCGFCDLMGNFELVNGTCQCAQYYRLEGQTCVDICGDGYLITVSCDDGNNIDGDGCSASCQVEDNYRCLIHDGETRSTCVYAARIELVLSSIVKDGQSNSFKAVFTTQPQINHLNRSDFTDSLQFGIQGSATIERYEFEGPWITAYVSYEEDMDGNSANFSIVYDPFVVRHPSQVIFFQLYDSNGVPLLYSYTNEAFKQLSQNLLLGLSAVVLVLLLTASWAHKMIGVQTLYTFQMVRVMQVLAKNYYPEMSYFSNMNLALGRLDVLFDASSGGTSVSQSYQQLSMTSSFVYNYQLPMTAQIIVVGLLIMGWVLQSIRSVLRQQNSISKPNDIRIESSNCWLTTFANNFYEAVVFPLFIGFVILLRLSLNMSPTANTASLIDLLLIIIVTVACTTVAYWELVPLFHAQKQPESTAHLGYKTKYPSRFVFLVLSSSTQAHLAITDSFPQSNLALTLYIILTSLAVIVMKPYEHKVHFIGVVINHITLIIMAAWVILDNLTDLPDEVKTTLPFAMAGLLTIVTLWALVRLIVQVCCISKVERQLDFSRFPQQNKTNRRQLLLQQNEVSYNQDLLAKELQKQRRKGINPYELTSQNERLKHAPITPLSVSKLDSKLSSLNIKSQNRLSLTMTKSQWDGI